MVLLASACQTDISTASAGVDHKILSGKLSSSNVKAVPDFLQTAKKAYISYQAVRFAKVIDTFDFD